MKTRIVKHTLLALFAAGGIISVAACDQPEPRCATGRGRFVAVYYNATGSDACRTITGDLFRMQTYNPQSLDKDTPDLNRANMAITSDTVGGALQARRNAHLADTTPGHQYYASGDFDTAEPVDNFCTVSKVNPMIQDLPEVPAVPPDPADPEDEGTPAIPATSISYEYTNFKAYVKPESIGSQVAGHVKRTRDGETCEYDFIAMNPRVLCHALDYTKPKDEATGLYPTIKPLAADESFCDPIANIEKHHETGSGINPDFATECREITFPAGGTKDFYCVPKLNTIPSLR